MDAASLAAVLTAAGSLLVGGGGLWVALVNRRDSRESNQETVDLAKRAATRDELTTIIEQQRGWNQALQSENAALRDRVVQAEAVATAATAEAVAAHRAADECAETVAALQAQLSGD